MCAGGVAALRTATPPLRLSAQVASVCDTLWGKEDKSVDHRRAWRGFKHWYSLILWPTLSFDERVLKMNFIIVIIIYLLLFS